MGGAAGSFSFYSHLGRFSYILQLSVYVGEENEEKDTQHIRWIREWGGGAKQGYSAVVWKKNYMTSR